MTTVHPRLSRFAWFVVAYNLAVILWGAWVRISFSGAGCGSHWPTCGGELVPTAPTARTLIEYVHRLSSGVSLLLVLALVVWAFRALPRGHRGRRGAVWTAAFLLAEAALGAGLVLFGLVENDDSVQRAFVIALHLVNTLALTAFGALTAWWTAGGPPLRGLGAGTLRWGLLAMIAAFVLTGMTGAITALGDTLFPLSPTDGDSLIARIRGDLSPAVHFLVRLRIVHPALAILLAVALGSLATSMLSKRRPPGVRRQARLVLALTLLQVIAGFVTIALHAPALLQLLHLLLAQLLWIALVLLFAEALAETAPPPLAPER
ncbi:MAG: hypothetical protein AMXMBFR64_26220 [Myxococcales bacterium]